MLKRLPFLLLSFFIASLVFAGDANDDADDVLVKTAIATTNDKSKDKPSEKTDDKDGVSSAKLATIDVTGVDNELKKNIELHMPVNVPECTADRAEVKQFFTTVKEFEKGYESFGLLRCRVSFWWFNSRQLLEVTLDCYAW